MTTKYGAKGVALAALLVGATPVAFAASPNTGSAPLTTEDALTLLAGLQALDAGYGCKESDEGAQKIAANGAVVPPIPEHYQCSFHFPLKVWYSIAADEAALGAVQKEEQDALQKYNRALMAKNLPDAKVGDMRAALKQVVDAPNLDTADKLRSAASAALQQLPPAAMLQQQDEVAQLAHAPHEISLHTIAFADLNLGDEKGKNNVPRGVLAALMSGPQPIVVGGP